MRGGDKGHTAHNQRHFNLEKVKGGIFGRAPGEHDATGSNGPNKGRGGNGDDKARQFPDIDRPPQPYQPQIKRYDRPYQNRDAQYVDGGDGRVAPARKTDPDG